MSRDSGPNRYILSSRAWDLLAERLGLSPREVPILRGLLNDKVESRIAREMGISVHTVHTHVKRLYRKLEVNSGNALTARVFEEYLKLEQSIGAGLDGELRKGDGSLEEPIGLAGRDDDSTVVN